MMSLEKLVDFFIEQTRDSLNEIKSDQKDMQIKIDQLLEFKWQIVGGSVVLSFLVSLAFNLFEQYNK